MDGGAAVFGKRDQPKKRDDLVRAGDQTNIKAPRDSKQKRPITLTPLRGYLSVLNELWWAADANVCAVRGEVTAAA